MKPSKSIFLLSAIFFLSSNIYAYMPHVTVLERLFLYKEISKVDLLNKIAPLTKEGTLRAVIEIPAGSTEKWVVSKDGKAMLRKFENGEPSTINYLGYPANYGFIPKSLKPLNKGGEPLDVLVLGNILPRGMVVKVKPIGILKLTENGEQDDKLITLHESSPLYSFINTIDQLQEKYPGILEILKLWFENYKGAGKVKFHSLMDSHMAKNIVEDAIKSYKEHKEIN